MRRVSLTRQLSALRPEVALISPLSRTVQTALLALQNSPSTRLEFETHAREMLWDEPCNQPGSVESLKALLGRLPRGGELLAAKAPAAHFAKRTEAALAGGAATAKADAGAGDAPVASGAPSSTRIRVYHGSANDKVDAKDRNEEWVTMDPSPTPSSAPSSAPSSTPAPSSAPSSTPSSAISLETAPNESVVVDSLESRKTAEAAPVGGTLVAAGPGVEPGQGIVAVPNEQPPPPTPQVDAVTEALSPPDSLKDTADSYTLTLLRELRERPENSVLVVTHGYVIERLTGARDSGLAQLVESQFEEDGRKLRKLKIHPQPGSGPRATGATAVLGQFSEAAAGRQLEAAAEGGEGKTS